MTTPITNQEESEKPDVEVGASVGDTAVAFTNALNAEIIDLKAKLNAAYESASISESARLEAERELAARELSTLHTRKSADMIAPCPTVYGEWSQEQRSRWWAC